MTNKKALVFGAGGFIGTNLVKYLKNKNYYVIGADKKYSEFESTKADEFLIGDLTEYSFVKFCIREEIDELYQLAADMGGAGYIFSKLNDANVMTNSALINLNTAKESVIKKVKKVFFSSSACIYPEHNQLDPNNPNCSEESAYPAAPDSEYGWEKLFSERLYLSYNRNHGLDIRIGRFHNIFGPQGTYKGGKEKAPAALCRKIVEAKDGGSIEIWGDGKQTRSFLYIDECLEAVERLMNSNYIYPINIGSDEMVTINDLAQKIISIANKKISLNHIDGPLGVRGRNSDNKLIKEKLNWAPNQKLEDGLSKTYQWIKKQVENAPV
jgi:nucleoside-diphosphate-sugar epimerase